MAQETLEPKQRDEEQVDAFREELDALPTAEPDRAVPASFKREPVYKVPGNQPSKPIKSANELRQREEQGQPDFTYRPTSGTTAGSSLGGGSSTGSKYLPTKGINSTSTTPGNLRISNLLATRKRKIIGGTAATGLIGGSVFLLTLLSGPAEFIQLSHVLQRNLSGDEHTSHLRLNGLYRYAKSGNIGETRVGWAGSKIFGKTIDQLKDLGIEFQLNNAGYVKSTTFDTEKLKSRFPELEGMSLDEQKSFLARKFELDIRQINRVNGKFAVNTRDFGVEATRALVNNSLYELDDGRTLSTIKGWVVSKYLDIPSLFHPLQRAKANIKKNLSVKAERAARQAAEEERTKPLQNPAATSDAVSARTNVKNALKDNQGKIASVLIAQAGVCMVRNIANDAVTYNRTAIVLPATAQAADKIAIGEQIQSNQDFDVTQLGPIRDNFTDSNGKSIWASPALQATAGSAISSSPDVLKASAPYEQAFSGNTTADKIRAGVDKSLGGKFFADQACGPVGLIVGGVLGIGAIVAGVPTGGASWGGYAAIKGAELAATAGIMYMLQQQIEPLVQDKAIVPSSLSGPLGGNILAYGAREMGNIIARSNGGVAMKGTNTTVVSSAVQQAEDRQFAQKNALAKIFDIHDYRSVAGRMVDNMSPLPSENIAKITASIFNYKNIMATVMLPFSHKAQAANTSYDWGFDRYGIPDNIATDQKYEDPYANAQYVATHILDTGASDTHGKSYIDKAKACFGVDINKDINGLWQVQPTGDVNPSSADYTSANCDDANEDWQRMMLFVFDSRTMDAAACYAGNEDSCALTNVDSTPVADTSSSAPVAGASSSFQMIKLADPLATPGGKITPKGITLHWWGSSSNGQGINALVSALRGNSTCDGGCSVQVGITADGKVYQMTNDLLDLTYHAIGGNQTTIGVEIEGSPADFGKVGVTKYPAKFQAVVDTVKYLSAKYNIPLDGPVNCGDVVGVHPHKAYNNCPGAFPKEDIDDYYFNAVMQKVRAG